MNVTIKADNAAGQTSCVGACPTETSLGPSENRRAYHLAMSRIGTFPDDDLAGWVLKSPDLGSAIGAFANAVYSKNRLPMRTRELARTVIAHSNECEVCVNTRDADGPAAGVDEDLYDHAARVADLARLQRPGAAGRRVRPPVRHRTHQAARGRRILESLQRTLFRRTPRRSGAVVRTVGGHGSGFADARYRSVLQTDTAKPGMNRRAR